MIGKTLAQYKIIELLGKGGMGDVYRARDHRLDRDVALKILSRTGSENVQSAQRFEREAKVLASLEHPNIATIYGFHEDEGMEFMAMELVSGSTLESIISDKGLVLERFLEVVVPLAEAIAFAHDCGVIHRDLKPANVMCDSSGRIKVLDFGLAALCELQTTADPDETVNVLTRTGEIMGTVTYMAPEQLEGRSVDARADVFSLGVILYELATGSRPFQASSSIGIASAILRDDPTPLEEVRPDLPADLARIIRRCLAKKADQRIQTARDVFNELEDIKAGIRTVDSSVPSPQSTVSVPVVEHRMVITTSHVRQLGTQIPRMIGDSMTYLDNERHSDVLLICQHGIGSDQRDFEDVLRHCPYRVISYSLYGFGPMARMRPALSYDDQNMLAGFLIEEVCQKIAPGTLILAGHSSGADQLMNIMSSPQGERIHPFGIILLGPAVVAGPGRMSGPYSRMTNEKENIFNTLRTLSGYAENLSEWLIMHDYLLKSFSKFGEDTAALQVFAKTYIESEDDESFSRMFRKLVERTDHLRCIFGPDDSEDQDRALEFHIKDNWLGDGYQEKMIVNVPDGHIELKNASVLLPVVEEILQNRN